jgi:hypothetical protein
LPEAPARPWWAELAELALSAVATAVIVDQATGGELRRWWARTWAGWRPPAPAPAEPVPTGVARAAERLTREAADLGLARWLLEEDADGRWIGEGGADA